MEFLRSFLWRHLAGKPEVASRNVGCFLRLIIYRKKLSTNLNNEYVSNVRISPTNEMAQPTYEMIDNAMAWEACSAWLVGPEAENKTAKLVMWSQ